MLARVRHQEGWVVLGGIVRAEPMLLWDRDVLSAGAVL